MQIDNKRLIEAGARAAPLDCGSLLAALRTSQAASFTAIAQTHHEVGRLIDSCPEQAIVTILQGRPGWRAAIATVRGSFHPGVAGLIVTNLS